MSDKKIKIGKLTGPFMGYKANATVIFVEGDSIFGILADEKDKYFGHYLNYDAEPMPAIVEEQCFNKLKNESEFFLIYDMIRNKYLKLPLNCWLQKD